MSWQTVQTHNTVIQVIPLDDQGGHTEDVKWESLPFDDRPISRCICGASTKVENNKYIIIHRSFDGREGVEWVNEILK